MKQALSILSLSLGLLACGESHAEEHAPAEPLTSGAVCQLAWEQHENQLRPADRLGNPFPMLAADQDTWRFEINHDGHKLYMIPSRTVTYQVDFESDLLDCEVPVSWKVLDSRLEAGFDPQLAQHRQITLINGKPFGTEAKGGLFLRHQLLAHDPHDLNLVWFLKSPPLKKTELIKIVRTALKIPPQHKVEVIQASDLLKEHGSMAIQALAMSVGAGPWTHWAMVPPEAAQLWPGLRFLPLGDATAAATPDEAWSEAGILDLAALKLWDVNQGQMVDCGTFGSTSRLSCRQVVDDAFVKIFKEAAVTGADLCVHLAWPGAAFSPYFVTTFCVDPQGTVRALGSTPSLNPGLPMMSAEGR